MKNRTSSATLACFALLLTMSCAHADEPLTKDDAVKMVKGAVLELQAVGHYKALNEISDPHGKFVRQDLYVTAVNTDGKCMAHGGDPNLVGQDLSKTKDVDGKMFIQERMTLAKTQASFWQSYTKINPLTQALAQKQTYCETIDDLIVCGGVYGL